MRQALYDRIGVGYSEYRRPEERIATRIDNASGGRAAVKDVSVLPRYLQIERGEQ
jgi:hypothetical protein